MIFIQITIVIIRETYKVYQNVILFRTSVLWHKTIYKLNKEEKEMKRRVDVDGLIDGINNNEISQAENSLYDLYKKVFECVKELSQ